MANAKQTDGVDASEMRSVAGADADGAAGCFRGQVGPAVGASRSPGQPGTGHGLPFRSGMPMSSLKSLREREKELKALLTTPEGKAQLQQLAGRYAANSCQTVPARTSLITYILVYERLHGMICP